MPHASLDDLARALSRGPTRAYGMSAPFAAYAAEALGRTAPEHGLVAVVVADEATARQLAHDVAFFAGAAPPGSPPPALHIPAIDTSPYAEVTPDRAAVMRRLVALFRLSRGAPLAPRIAVASAASLLRKVIPRGELDALTDHIRPGDEVDRDALARLLVRAGYSRMPVVEDPGTFAVRGGVIDLFPPLYSYPARVELFGDEIETVRAFDPSTQRTLRELDELHVHPVRETVPTRGADPRARILAAADAATHPSAQTRRVLDLVDEGAEFVGIETLTPAFHADMAPLWSYFPPGANTRWLILDPDEIARVAAEEMEIAARRCEERRAEHRLAFPPGDHYVGADALAEALAAPERRIEARTVELYEPEPEPEGTERPEREGAPPAAIRLSVDTNRGIRAELARARAEKADELIRPLVTAIEGWQHRGFRVAVASGSAGRTERLVALLAGYGIAARVRDAGAGALAALEPGAPPTVLRGALSGGFTLPAEQLVLLTEHDIFGERRAISSRQRAAAKRARDALLGGVADFSELEPGDYLVHQLHGIGLYKGLAKLPIGGHGGRPIDFLHLEYQGGNLYLPVFRLGEVQRYVGAEGHKVRLDKLGGVTWEKSRRKVSQKVRALAEELLQLYAQRAALPGHAYPPADAVFREFEATFEFEETPDQQQAIEDVLADLEAPRPMDRLVCGDVGYGKTEVALRAALKVVLGGKQVALLAPTTVLVEQHFQTMRRRFSGWPVEVARLSRFQSRAEQLATIKGLFAGKVDVVVGTHRLLSKDVRFAELGLLIIDEEQRFGVAHKERLKRVRTQVDVLTLTATPIPRTLHLAMAALRDLSIIATPPADRRSIRTLVARPDDGVLREGIRRELARGGQAFLVAPRIQGVTGGRGRSLEDWAAHLRKLVPEARVAVAHGQMPPDKLEQIMVGFVDGDYDLLVSTTIIENGLDIPRANTMFVVRADRFGLAQLYQLRGRIGRSVERAFCYLLVPPPETLTKDARLRLEALQRFSDLGAGFQIASHDLEIRGAGELLGARQSGSIAAVGFEMYTAMLEEAVAELRGEALSRPVDPELNVEVPGFIPDDYVPDTGQRLGLYKRLAGADGEDDVRAVLDEIADRYGAVPDEVVLLGDLMTLKAHARRLGATSLELTSGRLALALGEASPLSPEKLVVLVKEKRGYRLTPDMRLVRSFSKKERAEPVDAARAALLDLLALGA